jgi:hypothetical protein
MPHLDGCPRCLRRDNEPRSWDETTGKATYRCRCGWVWSTWWEHAEPGAEPAEIGELAGDFIDSLSRSRKE